MHLLGIENEKRAEGCTLENINTLHSEREWRENIDRIFLKT